MTFFPQQAAWFGGDFASIKGECSCPGGMFWDDDDLRCRETEGGSQAKARRFLAIIGIVVASLIGCCCLTVICMFCCC